MNGRRLHSRRHGGWLQKVNLKSKPAKGFAALTAMGLIGLMVGLIAGGGPAGADVTSVTGRAFGHSRQVSVLDPRITLAPPLPLIGFAAEPDVTLPSPPPPAPVTDSRTGAPSSALGYSSGPVTVSTSGGNVPGPTGFATSTATVLSPNVQGGTIIAGVLLPSTPNDFEAASVKVTCRSDAFTNTATVNIVGGSVSKGAPPAVAAPVSFPGPDPTSAPPNTVEGGLSPSIQSVVYNEQIPVPTAVPGQNKIVVNGVHIKRILTAPNALPGLPPLPVLLDDIIIGHTECGAAGPNVNAPGPPTLTKSFSPASLPAGGGASTATLVAKNGNIAGGANPTITDTFPAGQTPGNATVTTPGSAFACPATVGQTVTCTKAAAMAPGEVVTITVPLTATATATNTASLDNKAVAPVTGSATLPVGAITGAKSVTKNFSPNTLPAGGGSSTATIIATNGNTAGGANPTITDTFPAGQTPGATGTLTANQGFTCTTVGQTVSCTKAAAMAANEVATVTVPVTATATATNTASFDNKDGGAPLTASALLTVGGGGTPNGAITKSFNPNALPSTGGASTITITATNVGTGTAPGPVTVSDTLDTRLTPGTPTGNNGYACTVAGQVVTCTRTTDTPAGQASTITIPVTAAAGGTAGYTVSNTARLTAAGANLDSAPATLTVGAGGNNGTNADLSAQKRPGTNFVQNAQAIWLGIISNNGPGISQVPVTLTDTLPTGTTFQSAGGGNFTCSASGQNVNCTRPTALQVGEQAIVQIVVLVTAPAGSSVTNTLTVNGGAFDPVLANNTGTDTEVVQPSNSAIYYCPAYGNNNGGGGNQQQQQQKATTGSGGTSASSSQQQQGGGRGGGMGVSNNSQDQETKVNGKDGTTTQSGDQSSHSVSMGNGSNGYYASSSPYCPSNGGNGGGGNQQQQQQ